VSQAPPISPKTIEKLKFTNSLSLYKGEFVNLAKPPARLNHTMRKIIALFLIPFLII
jgi:hypothetical protein